MKLPFLAGAMILGITSVLAGQSAPQPGQVAPVSYSLPPSEARTTPVGYSADRLASSSEPTRSALWIVSICAALAATSMDAATSWGKVETNGVLASPNGTFGGKGITIKAGLAAGVLVPQILLRKHKDLKTAFTVGNFAEAGLYSAIAVHNLGIASPR